MSKHNRDRRERRREAEANLPPGNRVPRPLGRGYAGGEIRPIAEYGVGSWCPTQDGSGPATAVVLHFTMADGQQFGLRLKSARAVDELIAMLERHRNDVWPGEPS
jgi:hypothetical protein